MIMWNAFFNETSWTSYDKLIILLASEDFWRSSRPTTWRQNAFLVLCSVIHRGGPDVCDSQATTCSSAFLGGSFCDLRVHRNPWASIVIYGNPCEFVEIYGSWYAVAVIFVVLPAFAHPLDLLQHLFHWHFPWPRKTSLKTASQKAMERDELRTAAELPFFFLCFFFASERVPIRRNQGLPQFSTRKRSELFPVSASAVDSFSPGQPSRSQVSISSRNQETTSPCHHNGLHLVLQLASLEFNTSMMQKKQMGMVYMNMCVCVFNKARKGWSTLGRALFDGRKQWIWCL